MPHIFISYAKKDTHPLAKKLFAMINNMAGFSAWMDESLESGESWALQIQEEIDRADIVIVLLSPDVNRKPTAHQRRSFVLNEIDYAQQEHKPILPIMAQQTKMPVQIAGLEYIDFVRDEQAGMQRLLTRLQKLNLKPVISAVPLPAPVPATTSSPMSNLSLPLIGSIVSILAVLIAAFIFLPPLLNNGAEGTRVADNPTPTEAEITEQATQEATSTPSPTLESDKIQLAYNFDGRHNRDWTPYIYTFEDGIEMALVPVGCFEMGSTEEQIQDAIDNFEAQADWMEDETPSAPYCVPESFWIDVTEVTQAQFRNFGGEQANPSGFTGDRLPVENITWLEARDYCVGLGKRLPTEAEWEYAARGIESWIFPWGTNWNGEILVWRSISDRDETQNVGSYKANKSWVGALDMSGNVWELTSSQYEDYPYEEHEVTSISNGTLFVIRGGAYVNGQFDLRLASRYYQDALSRDNATGFRCVRDID